MKKNTYIKMTAPFRENNRAARKLELINKICTYLVFITYPVYVLYLCFTAGHMLALSIIAPFVGFIAVSVFRYIINRPRPYEKFDMPPVIPKDTLGRSFPSRHVFSAFIIAFTVLICSPAASPLWFTGILLAVLAAIIACVRVISGVHFISDVVGAFVFAAIEAYIVTVFLL